MADIGPIVDTTVVELQKLQAEIKLLEIKQEETLDSTKVSPQVG